MSKYVVSYLETCGSDYFMGSSSPCVQVMVDEEYTFSMIKEALLEYCTYESIFENSYFEDNFDFEKYERAVNECFATIANLNAVPSWLRNVGTINDYEEWNLYSYFAVDVIESVDE